MHMFWKYLLFEFKILLQNRKQWFLGLFLILLFPLYFQYYLGEEPETLESQKANEKALQEVMLDVFPDEERENEEGNEIYGNLAEQRSLASMQLYYVATVPGKKE